MRTVHAYPQHASQKRIKRWSTIGLFLAALGFSLWYVKLDVVELLASIPAFLRFLFVDFFPPNVSDIDNYMNPVVDTLIFAVVATCLSSGIGLLFGLLMAHNSSPHPSIRFALRGLLSFLRNIPFLVWASLLVMIFGIGSLPGLLALVLFGSGFLARVYAESIEELDKDSLEALDACGATYGQKIKHAIIPQFLPSFYSWTLFMFEINIRASAVLGIVGAGGLGSVLKQSMDLFQYSKTSTIIAIMVVLILIVEFITHRIRERLI